MISLMHFDKERYVGILDQDGKQLLVLPPFDDESIKPSLRNFKFKGPMATFENMNQALEELRDEYKVAVLSNMMDLWTRLSHGSASVLTPDKTRTSLIRAMERELGQSRIHDLDLKNLHTFHLTFGFAENHLRNIRSLVKMIDEHKANNLNYKLSQPSGTWKEGLGELIEHIKHRLLPNKRFEEASKVLTALKLHHNDLTQEQDAVIEELMNRTRNHLISQAIDRGESMAKPWQKYVKPEFGFAPKMPNTGGSEED